MVKKIDKVKYGEMILYLNRTVAPKLKAIKGQIVDNACNPHFLACENTLVQIKYILRDIDRRGALEQLSLMLRNSVNKLSPPCRGMINLLSLRDFEKQQELRKLICAKIKHTNEYYRMVDKALAELYDTFFENFTVEDFMEDYMDEPLMRNAIRYAESKDRTLKRKHKVPQEASMQLQQR